MKVAEDLYEKAQDAGTAWRVFEQWRIRDKGVDGVSLAPWYLCDSALRAVGELASSRQELVSWTESQRASHDVPVTFNVRV